MHNTAAIWRTRCDVTHDNKERDKILKKMRETANDAHKVGVFTNANESVQRACEIHKKLADRKNGSPQQRKELRTQHELKSTDKSTNSCNTSPKKKIIKTPLP